MAAAPNDGSVDELQKDEFVEFWGPSCEGVESRAWSASSSRSSKEKKKEVRIKPHRHLLWLSRLCELFYLDLSIVGLCC